MDFQNQKLSQIFSLFPKLQDDPLFAITSKCDVNYNCIAWASLYNNVWIWPILNPPQFGLEGVKVDWPEELPVNTELSTFIKYFNKQLYVEESKNYHFEEGYQKIAIFVNENLLVEHAARQKINNGKWASKLGKDIDIEHSSPYDLEGSVYGKVAIILKRPFL